MSDRADVELDLLREALTIALRTSQRRTPPDAAAPPSSLAPFASFRKFPPAALSAARLALDGDDEYRDRVAEVVGSDDSVVGRAGWLFLHRPEQWGAEFESLVMDRLADDAEMEDRGARKELERSNALNAELTERLAGAAAREQELRADLDSKSDELSAVLARVDALDAEASKLAEDRASAVRQLKAVEMQLAARHEELAELRKLHADELAAHAARLEGEADRAALQRARDAATIARQQISDELNAARERAQSALDDLDAALASTDDAEPSDEPAPRADGRRVGRRPQRIGRGIAEDSVDAASLLLSERAMDVLVDGYNVAFNAWPTMSAREGRELLIQRLERLDASIAARVTVVFDGVERSRGTSYGHGSRVRVRFTDEGREADDEILALIGAVPPERGVTVVSDDRRVVDGARRRGANVIRSTRLVELFRS